jgi:curved DNA-binding protein CbpA
MESEYSPDYYEVLQVAQDASHEEIKASYRQAVRRHHPDAAPLELKEAAHEKIQIIIAAWTTLRDTASREAYDEKLRRSRLAGHPPLANARDASSAYSPQVARDQGERRQRDNQSQARHDPHDPGEARKKNRVQAVMGGTSPSRSVNPRTKLLAMVFDAAQMYHVEGRTEEAARICRQVLRADPTNAEAAVLLADIYVAQSQRAAALDLLERALRLQPSNALYRSKWEALRHTTGSTSSTSTVPSPSQAPPARSSGANPWSKAPSQGSLSSRIAERTQHHEPHEPKDTDAASHDACSIPQDSVQKMPTPPSEIGENSDGNATQGKAAIEHKATQDSAGALGGADISLPVARRDSMLKRLRSKLSR